MSKKCEYCGSGIKDGAKFCEACGAPVKQKDEVKAPKKENKTEEFSKNRAEQKSTEQRPAQKPVFRGVSIMLAVMLCIELAVAGFKYPGFFVKHDYDSNALLDRIKNAQSGETGDSGTQNLSYDAMEERECELNADTAPATPAVINVRVSDEEVAAAVPEKAAVSKESHVCTANGVTVDFKPWNLNGDDTLAVRSIGERSDEENGVSLEIYDFSLESGQNKFLTSVDVSIPRPQDGSGDGEDCAWLDNVVWTADDPLPPLDVAATDSDAQAIIAGLSDVRLSDTISNTTAYAAFRFWVDSKGLSHALVKDAPNAWLSYMLDAPGLMAKAALTSEDVVIESVKPSDTTTGSFDLVVDIGGAEIGEGARLTAALGVEGATELDTSAFTPEGLSITLERTADSKTKATVIPTGTPSSFFMRVKVK